MNSNPRILRRFFVAFLGLLSSVNSVLADGPADNQVQNIRPVPPLGIDVPAEIRESLSKALEPLKKSIDELSQSKDPRIQNQLPDAEIFYRAVSLALNENGFFEPADFDRAKELIAEGVRRCEAIRMNVCDWTFIANAPYITVRGFRSKLDGTVQPYGVVYKPSDKAPGRADVWCRGRSEKGLELQFLSTRMKNSDPQPDAGVLMIHPFGRYCNANKLAGEIDTLEALEHAMSQYSFIDPKRVAIRGFSMGGAAAWHLAVHYPDRWFAATPGAGFSETPDFLKVFQSETLKPYWFEEKLWTMYDCPVWVRNLHNIPTIAYSGEIDKQKQAADIMAKASWGLPEDERFELTHIVAPKTAHSISPEAKKEIERRLRILDPASNLLPARLPKREDSIVFTTTTLRYNRAFWVTIDAIENHHEPSTIRALFTYSDQEFGYSANNVSITIDQGITQFTLERDASQIGGNNIEIQIVDESAMPSESFEVKPRSDGSFRATFRLEDGFWQLVSPIEQPASELRKKHMLQGPIDDALLAPFLFVRPTAKGLNPKLDQWVQSEFDHAVREWHRQMRGDVRIKSSEELTPADFQNYHLILWGDPKSNPTIAKVLEADGIAKLPLKWNDTTVELASLKLASENHVPLMIYPNPLAPDRYVVFNSSFTYREYDYLNNARQVPKLPDWAMIDVNTPPDGRWPGKIVQADFFDEAWKVKPIRQINASP